MDFFTGQLVSAVSQTMSAGPLLMILAGVLVGLVFGIIPGLQTVTALGVALPLTFWWDPLYSMYFFAGIIGACGNGGSIPAILLNMPGTASNAAAALDGYPLAQQGKAVFALNVSASASVVGALLGIVALVALIPIFSPLLMNIGPAEIFWIATFGLVTMVFAIVENYLKGFISLGIGIVLTQIGLGGPGLPVARFTFESNYLTEGVHIIVVVLGFLVVSEILKNIIDPAPGSTDVDVHHVVPSARDNKKQVIEGLLAPFRHMWTTVRSAGVGLLVGIVPGVGGSVAQFVSYNTTVMAAKDKSRFGKGAVDGLISSEAAVNAKEGGQLFPTLLFGIPGSAEMAIVLAAWQIHGLNPGPFFLRDYGVLAWALIFGLVVSNVISGLFAMSISTKLSKVRSFDIAIVSCVVLVFTVVAVYIIRQNVLDILAVIAFGIVGLYMKGYGYSVIGVVIGFVLGSVVEENWNLTIQSNYNSYMGFFNSATSLVLATLTALTVLAILYLYCKTEINKRRGNHG